MTVDTTPTPERPRQYVLDTNVIISDPYAVFKFSEHDVVIPMIMLEELDAIKDGRSPKEDSVKFEVRQAVHVIKSIVEGRTADELSVGVPIAENAGNLRILNDFEMLSGVKPILMAGVADNRFIQLVHHLQEEEAARDTYFVTKDFNAQLKAQAAGVLRVEDYRNERQLTDIDLMSTGFETIEQDLMEVLSKCESLDSRGGKSGVTIYEFPLSYLTKVIESPYLNQYILSDLSDSVYQIREIQNDRPGEPEMVVVRAMPIAKLMNQSVFGIKPRSLLQALAMHALMDETVDFVQLTGPAGSGKTLLALAAAFDQSKAGDKPRFNKIIVTRVLSDMTEGIGYLPGTEEEKMSPWLAAIGDSIEILAEGDTDGSTEGNTSDKAHGDEAASQTVAYLTQQVNLQYKSTNFMRGRSLQRSLIILDESQNITPHQAKSILTRVGKGSKLIVLGNLGQIDAKFVTPLTSGLTHIVERMKPYSGGALIDLPGGERGLLSAFAEEHL